jgi:ring-1,2-phenylacetyl-CoA epoxidase subunit PaaB
VKAVDTQWPRYEVFVQTRPGQPHRNAGAVHAPDAELALLNARDVFGRRPECASLWVTPASVIYSRTAEELAAEPASGAVPPGPLQTYHIFRKESQRQANTYVSHVGTVNATSPATAVRQAAAQWESQAFVWWAVPDSALTRTAPSEAPTLFAPALDKPFRQPNFYHVLTQMRAVKDDEAGS